MNILIIATGGTIGSAFDGSSINVDKAQTCAVAEEYAHANRDVQFNIQKPLNILSESLTCYDLNTLARALLEADLSSCDGVILTVGSDNLAYLSAFVGLLFADAPVPVCIVASDKVLSDPAANGRENFSCAVELIRSGKRGAFVPYRNFDGVMYVHSATDIRQADLCDDFYSFHGAYAVFDNGVFAEKRPYIAHKLPISFDRNNLPIISDNVLLIHPYPMQDYSRFCTGRVKAVLHMLYHSATLDTPSALEFIRSCGAPVYLASFRGGRKLYQTAADAIDAGAIPLFDISPECAYMKLLFACSQNEMPIERFMEANT